MELGILPGHRAEHAQLAKDWWRGEMFRLLPGEEGDHTVYVIDFYDRCKYFGYTREPVFYRAASLAAHIASWGTNTFVEEHAAQLDFTQNPGKVMDDITFVRSHWWLVSEGFSLSTANSDVQKLPATLYHRIADSLAYAA